MSLIKVKEVIGFSDKSFEHALQVIVDEFCGHKQNVTGIKVIGQSAEVKDGKVVGYKVNANVAYLWDKEIHKG